MPANGMSRKKNRNGDRNGPARLPRRGTRGLPSALAAACVAAAALGLAACSGPASGQPPAASPRTVNAGSLAPVTGLAAPSASATGSAAAQAPPAQPGPAAAAHRLAPARLPADQAESWTAQKAGPVREVGGHDIELNECATVDGAVTWQQQPYVSSGGNPAILETYTFATSAAARSAYAAVYSGMRSCQATSRALQAASHITPDAVSRQTASAAGAAAFERTWTGVLGISAAGPQINHLYLAVRGTTVLVLHFDELGTLTSPYDVRNDPAVVSMLIDVLTA
jgi:hypothetical protein